MAQLRQEVDPSEVGLDAKTLDRLDQHLAHYVDEGRLPGFLVSVARGGRVAHLTTHGQRDSRPNCRSRPTRCGGSTP